MIIDRRLQVSALQAISGTEAVPSTDVIDLGAPRLIGPGDPLWFVVVARAGLGGTSSPTIKFGVQTDDADSFGSPTLLGEHPPIAAGVFVAGARFVLPMQFTNERFLRLLYTMTGTAPTATIDAWLTNQDPTTWRAYPDAL